MHIHIHTHTHTAACVKQIMNKRWGWLPALGLATLGGAWLLRRGAVAAALGSRRGATGSRATLEGEGEDSSSSSNMLRARRRGKLSQEERLLMAYDHADTCFKVGSSAHTCTGPRVVLMAADSHMVAMSFPLCAT